MFNVCLLIWTLRSLRAEKCSALFTAVSSHPGQRPVHSCSMTIYQKTWTLSGLCIPLRCLVCLMCLIWLLLLPTLPARYSHKVTGDIHRVNSAFSNAYKAILSHLSFIQGPCSLSEGFCWMSDGQSPSWADN